MGIGTWTNHFASDFSDFRVRKLFPMCVLNSCSLASLPSCHPTILPAIQPACHSANRAINNCGSYVALLARIASPLPLSHSQFLAKSSHRIFGSWQITYTPSLKIVCIARPDVMQPPYILLPCSGVPVSVIWAAFVSTMFW